MTSEFNIKITIDGQAARADAGRLRQALEKELGQFTVSGVIDVVGLDAAHQKMAELRKDAGSLGRAMAQGLAQQWTKLEDTLSNVQSQITGIIRSGSAVEMAGLTDGMGDFAGALNEADSKAVNAIQEIKELDARIAGLTKRLGDLGATPVQPLSGAATSTLSELYKGFGEGGYKAYVSRLRNSIEKELNALTVEIGGKTVNLRQEIDKRVAENMGLAAKVLEGVPERNVAALQKHFEALGVQVAVSSQGLLADLDEVNAAIDAHLQVEPPRFSEQRDEWQAYLDQLVGVQQEVAKEIDNVRSIKYTGDTEHLIAILERRRSELESEKADDLKFWQEWSMENAQAASDALRAEGQSAAAGALTGMLETEEEIKRLRKKQKGEFGKLTQGGTAELPQGAQGTLVDFITAERALGDVATTATENLKAQTRALRAKVKAFDEARLAAEGFNEAERLSIAQLEKAAAREVRQATPARVGVAEAAAAERAILGRLAAEVASVSQTMQSAFQEAAVEVEQLATATEAALDDPVPEAAEKEAKGLLRLWEWISDKLVGHSVIPDMVNAINDWLALVGQDAADQDAQQIAAAKAKAQTLIHLARQESRAAIEQAEFESRAILEEEKRQTAEVSAEAKIRERQKVEAARRATLRQQEAVARALQQGRVQQIRGSEAAKRVTIRQRGATALDVEAGKADLREQARYNKLLSQAQQLTAEVGLNWADVAAAMAASGDSIETTIGGLKVMKKELAANTRESEKQARLTTDAQQLAAQVGISWDTVTAAQRTSGAELDAMVRELRKVDHEQAQIAAQVREIEELWGRALRPVGLFVDELNKAREARRGLFEFSRDLEEVGRSLLLAGGAVTGAVTVAGRDYVQFAKQSDVGARSLGLNAELTQQLRAETIGLSKDLAVLDPETTATGITVWAQATGQAVASQAELNALLAQTVPIQQAAALSQTDMGVLSDATAGAINQYGLTLADTTRIVAIFNKVSDDTLAAVGDVAEGFKYVGPSADRAGESIEATAVAFAILGDNGIRGTQAGTSYGKMLDNLLIPKSAEAEEALTQLFGSADAFYDAEGTFIGTARAVDMLAAALEGATDQERETALSALFDTNAMRAATVLIREQTEARQEGVNILQQSAATLSNDALAVWNTQLEDWEESDVYRVQQAEMRWKAFWLTIGQQGLDMALPYLEIASQAVEQLIGVVQANPWLSEIVMGVAGGTLLAGGIVTVMGTVSKTILSLGTIGDAFSKTILKQQTAEVRFQSTVVSAAERFSAIITQAAQQAATTENTGALQESAIEQQGAVQEVAIENAGAVQETAIENAGAGAEAAIKGGGAALGVGGAAAGTAAGAGVLGTVGAVGAAILGGLGLGGVAYEGLAQTGVGQALGMEEGTAAQSLSLVAYAMGSLVGKGDEAFRAVAEWTGQLEKTEDATTTAGESLQAISQDWSDAGVHAARATGEVTDQLYAYTQAAQKAAALTPEQSNAVKAYINLLKEQERAVQDFNDELAGLNRDLNTDLAKLGQTQTAALKKQKEDFEKTQAQQSADFYRQQEQARAEHHKRLGRMEEDHNARLWDFSLNRDASGLIAENKRYALEKQRAEEDFADQQGQETAGFQREQAQRAVQHEQQMADLRTQQAQERQARLDDYTQRVAELQGQHTDEMARLDQEYFDQLNADLKFYEQSEAQQNAYNQAMLADAEGWLKSKRALWLNYVAQLPVPSRSSTYPAPKTGDAAGSTPGGKGRASGGYATYGAYTLGEQGREFVLSANTTRQVEGVVGNLSQERVLAALGQRGSVQVAMPVTISGVADVAGVERAMRHVEARITRRLAEVLNG